MSDLWVLSTLLVVLAWIFSKQNTEDGPPLFNNEGMFYYDPDKVLTPSSLWEVQNIVSRANKNGHMVRPLGSGHSWNAVGQSENIYVSLFMYRGLVKLDKVTKTASFKGGTRLWEVNSLLAQYDFGLSILPSISNQTIGGAIATGTHGSGINFGHLGTYVTSIQLVTGTGEVLNVSPESDPEMFQAVGVSVGLLGIITEVTLKIEPIFNLHETSETYTLTHCIENIDKISSQYDHVKLWLEVASGTCAMFGAIRTKQPADSKQVISQPMTDIRMYAYEGLQWVLSLFPFATDFAFNILFATEVFPKYQRTAVSWEVFTVPHYISSNHHESEVAVPFNMCRKAIEDLVEIKHKFNIPINYIVEVRFVQKDNFWLSNSYGTDVCHVTMLLYNPSDYYWNLYSGTVFNVTHSYGGRLHWGKSFQMNQDQLRKLYPKFDDFLQIRKKLDPNGVFLNNVIKETFGI